MIKPFHICGSGKTICFYIVPRSHLQGVRHIRLTSYVIIELDRDSKATMSADKATFVYGGETPTSPNHYIRAYFCSLFVIFCELERVQMEASLLRPTTLKEKNENLQAIEFALILAAKITGTEAWMKVQLCRPMWHIG